jgi:dihydroorotate dehydrogenase
LNLIIKVIRRFPPEAAHLIALHSLNLLYKLKILNYFFPKIDPNSSSVANLSFNNRLGTAAGLDKNGDFIDCIGALGFGFIEVGTITPLPQNGNPKPRVFRIMNDNAVINRLGFNNKGVDHLVKNLISRKYKGIVGVNIGANKDSKDEERIKDYLTCFRKVSGLCDYITINISSPNTPGLRDLHGKENIKNLVKSIEQESNTLNFKGPIFLKISPDESLELIENIAEIIEKSNLTGLVISNTTIYKENLTSEKYKLIDGSFSGAPNMEKSTSMIKSVKKLHPNLPVIGVGGVMSKLDFNYKIESGADLVQIYTGFIINGPKIVSDILSH